MRFRANRAVTPLLAALALLLAMACSTDSPTEPLQRPAPPPGSGGASAVWNITVSVAPPQATVGSETPVTVTVRVRRADNGQVAPNGTTVIVTTNLGEFGVLGEGIQATVLALLNGAAQVFLYPGNTLGRASITAQLEGSLGRGFLEIVEAIEPVVASFSTANTDNNRSVQFLNQSTGDPTRFLWEFGDGGRSNQENPLHVYAEGGDYVVTLTASKPGSSDTVSQFINVPDDPVELFITAIDPNTGPASGGTSVTISGSGFVSPLRVFFGSKLGDVTSVSGTQIRVTTPPGDLATVSCDGNGDGTANGLRFVDTPVQVLIELSGGATEGLANAFTYLAPAVNPCVGDP